MVVPAEVLLCAAADHCLAAAYRSECPGVSPDALMAWRAASRAAFQGRTVEALLADVERARELLRQAPELGSEADSTELGSIRDLRGPIVPELPEGAAREGVAYLAGPLAERGSARQKYVLGAASPEQVRWFLAHAGELGLTDIYGDPARGFAGGYL